MIILVNVLFERVLGSRKQLADDEAKRFVDFAQKLWRRLRDEAKKGFERTNRELYTFGTYLSSAPTEKYQIERRDQKLREYFEYFKKTDGKIEGD